MDLAGLFNSSAFSMSTLTASINALAYVPNVLGELGIFTENGIATKTVEIEKRGQTLALVQTKPRGAPGTPMTGDKRQMVSFAVPHIPVRDALHPDEVQDVRQFGSANQLAGVEEVRDQKLLKMKQSLDMTLEYHRLGALQGLVKDADGTTLFDLFDEFGVTQPTIVDLNLDTAWTEAAGGRVRALITDIVRDIRASLGGTPMRGCIAMCGDAFFDAFVNHPEIRQTYLNQQAANELREQKDPFEKVNYGGVTFINYYGFGDVVVDTDECQFVPLGVPDLFITRFAPAPWFSATNTVGLPFYSMATLDKSGEKEIELEANTNPICLCTRPGSLFRAKRT